MAQYKPLGFRTPVDLLLAARPNFDAYGWQVEDLVYIAGYRNPISADDLGPYTPPTAQEPLYYTLQAANGAGKDSVIGAASMMWFLGEKPRGKIICTSASATQVEDQTEKPCRIIADAMNDVLGYDRFKYVQRSIVDVECNSELKFFATDDPGKAEGHHPNSDYPNAEMMIVMNEVKSLEQNIISAIERCHGFNYWVEYSSPGEPFGHFYDACNRTGPNCYHRHVTAFDCPHISKEQIERMITKYGINHPLVRSSIFGEFHQLPEATIISDSIIQQHVLSTKWNDGVLRAGIDLGLGGDDSVCYIYKGNRFHTRISTHTSNSIELVMFFISNLKLHGVKAENVNVDGSGIGKPIIDIFHSKNFSVKRVKNDDIARNKTFYLNRGAEIWDKGKMLLQGGAVELPPDMGKWRKEITTRRAEIFKGRLRLEDKKKARKNGRPSPNNADAWMLVWAQIDLDEIGLNFGEKGQVIEAEADSKSGKQEIVRPVDPDRVPIQAFTDPYAAYNHIVAIQPRRNSIIRPASLYT